VSVQGETVEVELAVPGAYNGYNAAAALLASARLGVAPADAIRAMEAMEPAFGRGQVVERGGRRVKVLLVKNPASLNQAILLLRGLPGPKSVLVAINDEFADGRDVSWLWDAHVEALTDTGHRFGAGGVRAADMALRFKYAGVEAWAEEDFEAALDRLVASAPEGDTVYVVPTYTAMLTLLRLLVPGASPAEVWK
jgi:UDP-N-acetylmuramyl tripeptide synthase